ncbi:hypothetical protein ANCCAN_29301 [Ancylostoma caninum]|uniref:Uncharacterized protein n=1 Tax=Ancylostoma caninum TaxID=29170 RepID=A0A368F1W4_ANCCA|nr:hypothetical protein ANCCAN_29301 [Ancylostoma caninum]
MALLTRSACCMSTLDRFSPPMIAVTRSVWRQPLSLIPW